ncbi:unnamed protein product [Penicillium salamii]|uniref:Protein kinase domain-containing protein n=1 Tax=Penicillium salamii TaxID=1612424 RepID=A0A9W4NTK5_9EURO|nr:unnamed protein product [Penicillium salamii]CAG8395781.1 unnamed protein product [Penicillium salamii]CAG8414956.1 unnamed protein product [Penicillium salamii]CAG8420197.1 unnamed protein product [Penicillium salamii]
MENVQVFPKNTAPGDFALGDAVPKDAADEDATPKGATPKDATFRDTSLEDTLPEGTVPEAAAPEDAALRDTVPEDTVPEATVPKATASEPSALEDAAPKDAALRGTVPEDNVPEDNVPEPAAPEASALENAVFRDTLPEGTVPEATVPEAAASEATASEATASEPSVLENAVFTDTLPEATVPEAATPEATASKDAGPEDTEDFGRFVEDSDEEVDLSIVVEPWHTYKTKDDSTIFYPIFLVEVLNERYLVEHKLGYGGGSIVWMAFDLRDKKNVALKVMAPGKWADNEIQIQDEIIQQVQDTSGLVIYTETFLLLRDDGRYHRVMVLPLKGPSICTRSLKRTPMAARMSAARQLLVALANLHEAGILHRDITPWNCMWGITPIDNLSRSAKYELLDRPVKQTIPFVELWKRGELVSPVEFPDDLRTDEFYLCDFGLAKKIDDQATQTGHPQSYYCSPDRLHKHKPSFACDMWSYMTVFSMLYLTFPPFHTFSNGGVLRGMVECLGPLPEQWKDSYPYHDGFDTLYDQSRVPVPGRTLAARIAHFCPDSDVVERELVEDIMSKVFMYDIEKRLTAKQLLQDPSFKALMDRYGAET